MLFDPTMKRKSFPEEATCHESLPLPASTVLAQCFSSSDSVPCLSFSPGGRGAARFPEAKRSHQADALPPEPPVPSHLPHCDEAAEIPPLPGFYRLPPSKFSGNPFWGFSHSNSSSHHFYLLNHHTCHRLPPVYFHFPGRKLPLKVEYFLLTLTSTNPMICCYSFLRLLFCFRQNLNNGT